MKTRSMIMYMLMVLFAMSNQTIKAQSETELFENLFETQNVGNLHLYAHQKPLKSGDFLVGQDIPKVFHAMFPLDIRERLIGVDAPKPKAIFSIRGNDLKNFYIVRVPDERGGFKLDLFEMVGKKLYFRKNLASYNCDGNTCRQVDTWIMDVNQDTRLDLIQKVRLSNKRGAKEVYTDVFYMLDNGQFQRTDEADLDMIDYQMKSM
ncbi:MAG: hypothetical protein MRY78_10335 [Saprospiraceae bacterium]|nr:hypothetical protein [Saprospiraceae bacterium]